MRLKNVGASPAYCVAVIAMSVGVLSAPQALPGATPPSPSGFTSLLTDSLEFLPPPKDDEDLTKSFPVQLQLPPAPPPPPPLLSTPCEAAPADFAPIDSPAIPAV